MSANPPVCISTTTPVFASRWPCCWPRQRHSFDVRQRRGFPQTADHNRPACLLLDVRLPGMELLQQVTNWPQPPIVVMITGHGDVPLAVGNARRSVPLR